MQSATAVANALTNLNNNTNSVENSSSLSSNANSSGAALSTSNQLNESDFLTLMTQQLQDQDPTDPQSSADFVAEMAQFGTVTGISQLQNSFSTLSSSLTSGQTLQAASLVGQSVSVDANTAPLTNGGSIQGSLKLPSATNNINVVITDSNGNTVKTLPLGSSTASNLNFTWNGLNSQGQAAPAGTYTFTAQGTVGTQTTALSTSLAKQVTSVTVGSGGSGLTLNLADGTTTSISNVSQIY